MINLKSRRIRKPVPNHVPSESTIIPDRRNRLKHPVKKGIQALFSFLRKKTNQ